MDSGKVISMNGQELTGEIERVDACVEALEFLLERAKSGNLVGFGYVDMDHMGVCRFGIAGHIGSFQMVGAAEIMASTLREAVLEECQGG